MKSHTKKRLAVVLLCFLGNLSVTQAVDDAHFYKAPGIRQAGPRVEHFYRDTEDWHSMFDVSYAYGSTKKGQNVDNNKTELLNIYGEQNLLYLTTGVPKKAAVTDFHNLLTQMMNHSNSCNGMLGKLEFKGEFDVHEVHINWRQNFSSGFFGELHLPIRSMEIDHISYNDKSPSTGCVYANSAEWIRVKNNFNTILNAYGINNYDTKWDETDVGDLSLYLGWQHVDSESFDFLKFLSTTVRAGLLFPTGSKDETNYAFSLPNGYNGHWGIPIRFDLSVGASHWLTIGLHAGAIFFFDRSLNRRMKTHKNQNGWIKLAEGMAKVEKGTLWDIGGFVKFDHFVEGLSAVVGYSFNAQEDDELHPRNKDLFSDDVVNSDRVLKSWYSHVIHLLAEYDFGVHMEEKNWAPHLGLFYDFPVDGEYIFNTDMIGGNLGFHFMWKF